MKLHPWDGEKHEKLRTYEQGKSDHHFRDHHLLGNHAWSGSRQTLGVKRQRCQPPEHPFTGRVLVVRPTSLLRMV